MFSRATIRLGIDPHSRLVKFFLFLLLLDFSLVNKDFQ